jgi:hypothetical protein
MIFTNAKKIDDAIYLLQVIKHSDTEYVCRYYNKFGPMVRQETFLDSAFQYRMDHFCGMA